MSIKNKDTVEGKSLCQAILSESLSEELKSYSVKTGFGMSLYGLR